MIKIKQPFQNRLKLTDTPLQMIVKLAEGNPGAAVACGNMASISTDVDPQAFAGPYTPLVSLDSFEIYGPRIWMLYKDVCGESTIKSLACLRAVQLGLLLRETLDYAIDNRGQGVDRDEVLRMVQERLPLFGKEHDESADNS